MPSRLYKKTGKHLGVFDNADDATTYAKQLHESQAQQYWRRTAKADHQGRHASGRVARTPFAAAPMMRPAPRSTCRKSTPKCARPRNRSTKSIATIRCSCKRRWATSRAAAEGSHFSGNRGRLLVRLRSSGGLLSRPGARKPRQKGRAAAARRFHRPDQPARNRPGQAARGLRSEKPRCRQRHRQRAKRDRPAL
jgi:hypothetical protein